MGSAQDFEINFKNLLASFLEQEQLDQQEENEEKGSKQVVEKLKLGDFASE